MSLFPLYVYPKVSKGREELSFYSIPEFEEWKNETPNSKSWRVKYYKGLGTSTPKEAKEYFADMRRHQIIFQHEGAPCDEAILMVGCLKNENVSLICNFIKRGQVSEKSLCCIAGEGKHNIVLPTQFIR